VRGGFSFNHSITASKAGRSAFVSENWSTSDAAAGLAKAPVSEDSKCLKGSRRVVRLCSNVKCIADCARCECLDAMFLCAMAMTANF